MEPMYIYAPLRPAKQKEQLENDITTQKPEAFTNHDSCRKYNSEAQDQKHTQGYAPLLFMMFAVLLTSFAARAQQTSQQKSVLYKSISPASDHNKTISAVAATAKGGKLDSIAFPARDFRRGAYLKMRTVYVDVPVEAFKIKPYPANSSDQTRAELDFLLELQQKRTTADVATTDSMASVYYDPFTVNQLDSDYKRNVKSLFYVGRNIGPWFNPAQLPVTSRVLQNVIQDATFYFFSIKSAYNRARPYQLEPALKNLEAPGHPSYPSGHSSASYVQAYLLSYILPEYKSQFMSNAYDMAFSREIRGVHYPSDSEAGRAFAEQFVAQLLTSKQFKADLAAMRAEIERTRNQNAQTSLR
jgi:acid phosphatase (class A)